MLRFSILVASVIGLFACAVMPHPGVASDDHGYRAFWLTGSAAGQNRAFGPTLLISQVPIEELDEHAGVHGRRTAISERSLPLLDQPAVILETYQKDSIWNADGQPIKPLAGVRRVNESSGEITIDRRDYRFEPCPLAEVIHLLENPEGTIPLHRADAPLAGARKTAHALVVLLNEQLQNTKGADARSRPESPRRRPAVPNGWQNGTDDQSSGECGVILGDGVYAVVSLESRRNAKPEWAAVLPVVPVEGSETGEPKWIVVTVDPLLRFKTLSHFDFTFEKNVCTQIGFQNTAELKAWTRDHVGSRLAVVVGNRVITHHKIREPITSERVRITCCTTGGGDHLHKYLKDLKLETESDGAAADER